MKFTTILAQILLMVSVPLSLALAGEPPATVQITAQNASLRKNYFEITDSICRQSMPHECRLAEIIANGEKCREQERSDGCAEARAIVDSPECMTGIVFYGWLESGEMVPLSICTDQTGKGRIKTRNSQTAPWTLHSWIEAGETISIK